MFRRCSRAKIVVIYITLMIITVLWLCGEHIADHWPSVVYIRYSGLASKPTDSHLKSDQDLRMDVPVSHGLYSTFTRPRPRVHSIYSKTSTPDQPSSELYNRHQDQNQKWPQDSNSTDKEEFPSQQDLQPSLCSQGVTVKRHTQQECRDVLCSEYLTEKDWTNFHQCREKFHSKFNCTLQVRQVCGQGVCC